MGNTYLERGARGVVAFATIATAGLQTASSSGEASSLCPPTATSLYGFAQKPDFPTDGINFKITKQEQPWYYSLAIERIFNPDGSMNIPCGMLEDIKRDAAKAALAQYAGRDKKANSQNEQLTANLMNATSFLDGDSYEDIKKRLIQDKKISANRSANDIYVLYNGRVFINRDSALLTRRIANENNTVAYLNPQGYPTRSAEMYLQSAYVVMLHDAPK